NGICLLSNGGYTLICMDVANAQAQPVPAVQTNDGTAAQQANSETARLSTIEEAAAQRAADDLFSATNTPVPTSREEDARPVVEDSNGDFRYFDEENSTADTKEAVLQRLSERRSELDSREQALVLQESLVAAAEMRLNERIASLEAVEARVQSLLDQQVATEEAQFDALVSMYANMKSSDAATVFNSLNMEILLRLATKMSPRKMSPILADMTTERAQELTIRIATAQMVPETLDLANNPAMGSDDQLPQIVGQ
ncbi:MAG: hypothetical protein L3J13_05020, partial [Devosiaceae bacterium]|nr:hypothetical protein [Devosiaceae bacterium]